MSSGSLLRPFWNESELFLAASDSLCKLALNFVKKLLNMVPIYAKLTFQALRILVPHFMVLFRLLEAPTSIDILGPSFVPLLGYGPTMEPIYVKLHFEALRILGPNSVPF